MQMDDRKVLTAGFRGYYMQSWRFLLHDNMVTFVDIVSDNQPTLKRYSQQRGAFLASSIRAAVSKQIHSEIKLYNVREKHMYVNLIFHKRTGCYLPPFCC